jgi:hypothetical protein
MQSVSTSRSADRDIVGAIAAVCRRATELVLSIGGIGHRPHSTTTAGREVPERPWYDDPGAARGL